MKFLILLILTAAQAATAADWVLISAGKNYELEIDAQSVRPGKAAWFRYINTPPELDKCDVSRSKTSYEKQFVEANCKEFTIRTKKVLAYAEDGAVINSCSYDAPNSLFTEYAPETLGESMFLAICFQKHRQPNKVAAFGRHEKAVNEFLSNSPCPVDGKPSRFCPGYKIRHIIPQCSSVWEDKASNLQWLTSDEAKEWDTNSKKDWCENN